MKPNNKLIFFPDIGSSAPQLQTGGVLNNGTGVGGGSNVTNGLPRQGGLGELGGTAL